MLDHTGFTAQEQLDAFGLVHLNGRVYDPITGRMTSADPTIPNAYDLQSLNRASYVFNSPLGYADPTGFAPGHDACNGIPHCTVGKKWECRSVDGCYVGVMSTGGTYAFYRLSLVALPRFAGSATTTRVLVPTLVGGGASVARGGFYVLGAVAAMILIDDQYKRMFDPQAPKSDEIIANLLMQILNEKDLDKVDKMTGPAGGEDGDDKKPKCHNPDGCNGKPDHQDKVAQLADRARAEAKEGEQVLENKKVRGYDSNRKPDVQIVDKEGNSRQIYEAERYASHARNQAREAEYERLGIPNQTFSLGP